MEKYIKRSIGEIWKDGKFWKVQFDKGILTVKTKKYAIKISNGFYPKKLKIIECEKCGFQYLNTKNCICNEGEKVLLTYDYLRGEIDKYGKDKILKAIKKANFESVNYELTDINIIESFNEYKLYDLLKALKG